MRPDFGQRLRQLRNAAGLTQAALAERAGMSATSIAALERGRRSRPHPPTLRALGVALNLSEADLAALAGAVRPSAPATPPETATARGSAGQVPTLPTGLVGRAHDLAAMGELFQRGARLVTLTGPGGVGKTRLAVQCAHDWAVLFPDGVAFVDLAPLADATLVVPAMAQALDVRDLGGQTLSAALHTYLGPRRLLLVLDNVEHVLDAAPEVAELVGAADGLRVLATSRAPLRVRGEREYPLQPLPVPELVQVPDVQEVEANPAVALFVERARAVAPAFALTRTNVAAVSVICRRLDGLPLAIELAAARIRILSPTDLLARLDTVLPLLSGGQRDVPARQRTMRAAIAWSYRLLGEPQWRLLNRLSAFRGGWDLAAAEAVGVGGALCEEDVLDLVSDLVEQSLVVAEARPAAMTRYRMLVPLQEYAAEQLGQSGEAQETSGRHAAYFLGLAREGYAGLKGPDQVGWLARLEADHDNMRAALAWLIAQGDTDRVAELGWSLWLFWWMRGHFSEGRRWLAQVLALDLAPRARAWALLAAAVLAYGQADSEQAAVVEESLRIFREVGDEEGARIALGQAGLAAIARGDEEHGLDLIEEAVARDLAVGDRWTAALLLTYSAVVPLHRGDHARGERLAGQALALARETGDRVGIYNSLYNLASVARMRGDEDGAARLFGEALALSAQMGDHGNAAYCLESSGRRGRRAGGAGTRCNLMERRGGAARGQRSCGVCAHARPRCTRRSDRRRTGAPRRSGLRCGVDAGPRIRPGGGGRRCARGSRESGSTRTASTPQEIDPDVGTPLPAAASPSPRSGIEQLTAREVEVLRLLAAGRSNQAIADELIIAVGTVKRHVNSIMGKLQAASRLEAVARARDLRLV